MGGPKKGNPMKRAILWLIALVLGLGTLHDALGARQAAAGVGAWVIQVSNPDMFWGVVVANALLVFACAIGALRPPGQS